MSADTVDDLHAAEDRIGLLETSLRLIRSRVEGLPDHPWIPGVNFDDGEIMGALAVLDVPYVRPSCDEDCDNEFCGSPRHHDQEFNEATGEWETT